MMRQTGVHGSMRRGVWSLLAILLAVALVACGGPTNGGPTNGDDPPPGTFDPLDPSLAYLTDVEAAERVEALKNDAISIGNGFVNGALNAVVQGLPVSSDPTGLPWLEVAFLPVPHLVMWDDVDGWNERTLATGTYAYDESTLTWSYEPGPSDALVARWRSESTGAPHMELRVTWASQVTVSYPVGADEVWPDSVPTGWTLELLRNDVALVDLAADFAFRACDGVRMAEPTRLALSGFVGDGAASATIHALVLEAVSEDAIRFAADVDVRSGSLQLGIAASLSADATMERDDACWPTQPDAVEVTGTLQVTGPGPLTLVRGDVTATYDPEWGTYDLALRDGRFVSGDKRVDMVATIQAGEPDPASRLFLTFAGGVVRDVIDFVMAFGLAD